MGKGRKGVEIRQVILSSGGRSDLLPAEAAAILMTRETLRMVSHIKKIDQEINTMKRTIITTITILIAAFAAFGQESQPQPAAPQTVPVGQFEAKKEGVIRIGVVTIKTQIKQDVGGQDMAEVIRTRWYSYLSGPTIELIPIAARIPSQVNIEAGQKQCDYILYSAVTQKTKSSLFSVFIKTAVPVLASAVPVGVGNTAAASAAQSMRESVQEGAKNAAKNLANESASKIKAHDEVTLEFSFVKVNAEGAPVIIRLKATAKNDGDDIFSPLIEKAAEQIAETTFKG